MIGLYMESLYFYYFSKIKNGFTFFYTVNVGLSIFMTFVWVHLYTLFMTQMHWKTIWNLVFMIEKVIKISGFVLVFFCIFIQFNFFWLIFIVPTLFYTWINKRASFLWSYFVIWMHSKANTIHIQPYRHFDLKTM